MGSAFQGNPAQIPQVSDKSITYAKIQDISATDRILGRDTAGAGSVEELTLSAVLDMIGSAAQGDIFYRGASAWARLGAGTSGQVLQTNGAGANPSWATASGSGMMNVAFSAGPDVTLTNQPNTLQFFTNPGTNPPKYITKLDLTNFTQVRLCAKITSGSGSANSPRLILKYHTSFSSTVGDYSDIGTSEVAASISSPVVADSGWIDLAAGAKADVWVTVCQHGGNGAADPIIANVYMTVK